MKKNKRWTVIILVTLVVNSLFFYTHASGITIKEEEELSREVMKTVSRSFKLIEDPVIVDYVNKIAKRIMVVLPPQPFRYQFYVIKEDVYNAFATPAGHIFVNSGLIAAMESEEELAGILCHEISHVSARHISQKIERAKKVQLATMAGLIAGALLGAGGAGTAANALAMGSMAAGQSAMLAYSREDEMQADQLGLNYLARAGYNGKGLITMMQKMRDKQWFGTDQVPSYLMTHPASEDRIIYIDSWLARNPVPESRMDTYGFKRAHTFLVANYEDEETSLRRFEKAVKKTPEDAMAHYGYGLILARGGNFKNAVHHIQMALEAHAFDPYILKDLGKTYFLDGRYREALNIFENSMGINSGDPEHRFFLGRTQIQLGMLKEAVASLQELVKKYPRFRQVYYYLGEAYGKQGNLPEAHYNLGIYYTKTWNLKNARFHLKRALKDIKDPDKRKEIEGILKKIERGPSQNRGRG